MQEYALRMEAFGMPPLAGRVLAVMLLTDPPEKSTQDLIALTGGSKGAISLTLRILERFGQLEKCPAPGHRGHRWRLRRNFMIDMFQSKMNAIRGIRDFWEAHAAEVEGLSENVRRNVGEMARFHEFFCEEVVQAFERWKRIQAQGDAEPSGPGKGNPPLETPSSSCWLSSCPPGAEVRRRGKRRTTSNCRPSWSRS